jgi:hypothetical protein
MAGHDELRIRAQRLLLGVFQIDDLNRLFLFLRQNSYGERAVREVGDLVAHADEREKGVISESVTDFYRICKYFYPRLSGDRPNAIDIADMDPELPFVLESAFRQIDSDIVKRDTGLSENQARTALTKLKRMFDKKPDGRLKYKYNTIQDKYAALLSCLLSYIVSKPAFDGEVLFGEFSNLLLRHKLIDDDQRTLLELKRSHILLFTLALMHNVHYRLPTGEFAIARTGWVRPTPEHPKFLTVMANVNVSPNMLIGFAFPVFVTDLDAEIWADDIKNSESSAWLNPIELVEGPKLRRIRL